MEDRIITAILDTERTPEGEYIPVLIVENQPGYHRTNWHWGKDRKLAQEIADKRNQIMDISPEEANLILLGSMAISRTR